MALDLALLERIQFCMGRCGRVQSEFAASFNPRCGGGVPEGGTRRTSVEFFLFFWGEGMLYL